MILFFRVVRLRVLLMIPSLDRPEDVIKSKNSFPDRSFPITEHKIGMAPKDCIFYATFAAPPNR